MGRLHRHSCIYIVVRGGLFVLRSNSCLYFFLYKKMESDDWGMDLLVVGGFDW